MNPAGSKGYEMDPAETKWWTMVGWESEREWPRKSSVVGSKGAKACSKEVKLTCVSSETNRNQLPLYLANL